MARLTFGFAAVVLIMATALASGGPASAHRNNWDPSLNSQNQVVKKCFSVNHCNIYEWSRDTWNDRPGNPSIYNAQTGHGEASLYIGEDEYREDVEWVAIWRGWYEPDTIFNNNAYMMYPPYSNNVGARHVVSTHEIGHAFGYDHSVSSGAGDLNYCEVSVMFPTLNSAFKCGQSGYLMSHDRTDWVAIWGTD